MRCFLVYPALLILGVLGCSTNELRQVTRSNDDRLTRQDATLEPPDVVGTTDADRRANPRSRDGIVTAQSAVTQLGSDRYLYGYDPNAVVEVRGQVLDVADVRLAGGDTGVILALQPGGDMIYVFPGERTFLERHDVAYKVTDQVHATGSRIDIDGLPTVLVAELLLGDKTVRVRHPDGHPLWLGRDSTSAEPRGRE